MLNLESVQAVAGSRVDAHLARPLYETYGFAQVPWLVRALLTGQGELGLPPSVLGGLPRASRSVVLFLIDGFGWSYLQRFADELPFLRRALAEGVVSQLTTQFPSTTAAHVTTLHTGLPASVHGALEWQYYEPRLDEIFAPFLCSTLGPDGLLPVPRELLHALHPPVTFYEELARLGVPSRCYQPASLSGSTYSVAATRGAESRPYRTLPELMVNLSLQAHEPGYHAVYIETIDAISHTYGPDSPQVAAEIGALFGLIEDLLARALATRGDGPLVLLTADHGQTAVDPARAVYLDLLLPGCARWLRTTRDGRPLVPGGGPRDMFLYVRPECLPEAHETLAHALAGLATVHRTEELVGAGYFGPQADTRVLERVGELLILPEPHEMVWWCGGGRFTVHKRGHHGGLHSDEMEIPLLAWQA
jgi:hypothetical protein